MSYLSQALGPLGTPYPTVINWAKFRIVQGRICSILFLLLPTLWFLDIFSMKSIAQCFFPPSVLCSKLSVNQSLSPPLSKALIKLTTTFVLLASIKAAILWFCCSFPTDLLHSQMGQCIPFRKLHVLFHRKRTASLT